MRFNKSVQVRRKRYGKWWQAYGHEVKILSLARQVEAGIVVGDIVSKYVEKEGRLKAITIKSIYTYGKPPVLVYAFELGGKEYITEAKGWKRTEIKTIPFQLALSRNPKMRWKGEWKIDEASLFYPVKPYPGVV